MDADPPRLPRAEFDELVRRRRGRNWAMLIALLALSLLFYAMTWVKMGGHH
jgi:hypothetical protein